MHQVEQSRGDLGLSTERSTKAAGIWDFSTERSTKAGGIWNFSTERSSKAVGISDFSTGPQQVALCCGQLAENSIRTTDKLLTVSLDTYFEISFFERPALGNIDADFRNRILV